MAINILDNIDGRKLGTRLRQAREKRGMTQENAAQVIGAVRATMVAIEEGERRIRAGELIALAKAYGRPVSDFVQERPVVELQALVYRLEQMALLPAGTWDRLQARGFKARRARQEPGLEAIAQRADKLLIHYQHLAIEALDQGLITEGRFARFLGVDRLEARRIAGLLREHSSIHPGTV